MLSTKYQEIGPVILEKSLEFFTIYGIGVGRFRILGGGGPRFRILGGGGGASGGQIPSRHMTS